MTALQCPKCELRFSWRTELDDHCRQDHPDFQHAYRVAHAHGDAAHTPPTPWTPGTTNAHHE